MKKLLLLLLIPAILVLYLFPGTIQANAATPERYGYSLLTNDTQRTAYNCLVKCVSELKPTAQFKVSGVTQENVNSILESIKFAARMAYRDYPEYFWFDGNCGIGINGDTATLTPSAYMVNGKVISAGSKDLKNAQNALKSAMNKALAKINKNMSDYEIAHTVHDYLIEIITYEMSGDHQTAYGALVGGKAVCAGYTRAFQLLMNAAGIPCWYISGKSYAPNGQLFGHAWNLVWLDGMCYYTDVTWDDQLAELFHEYMNLCKEEISKTHFTDDPLPENCGHDSYTFFIRNDGKGVCDFHGHKTDKEIAGCFELREQKGDTAIYYCTIHYHGNDFNKWFDQHKVGIITELGLTGAVSCNIIELGLEHHVTFTGKVKGQIQQPETQAPTEKPTEKPTEAPTEKPTVPPTEEPTAPPTEEPTVAPTEKPTEAPTEKPTEAPTEAPTVAPTEMPTEKPTDAPTDAPTTSETEPATQAPTESVTQPETQVPTTEPTIPSTTQPADTSTATEPSSEEETGTVPQEESDTDDDDAVTTIAAVSGGVAATGAGAGGVLWFLRRRRF